MQQLRGMVQPLLDTEHLQAYPMHRDPAGLATALAGPHFEQLSQETVCSVVYLPLFLVSHSISGRISDIRIGLVHKREPARY